MEENKSIYICGAEFYHNCSHKYGQLCLNYCECDFKKGLKEKEEENNNE